MRDTEPTTKSKIFECSAGRCPRDRSSSEAPRDRNDVFRFDDGTGVRRARPGTSSSESIRYGRSAWGRQHVSLMLDRVGTGYGAKMMRRCDPARTSRVLYNAPQHELAAVGAKRSFAHLA
eukprot:scaffold182665_cov35-Tisochrysis_lutea.AAC.1